MNNFRNRALPDVIGNHARNFSRKSLNVRKNHYQCLQIAHIINQLTKKTQVIKNIFSTKESLTSLLDCIIAFMMLGTIESFELQNSTNNHCQIKY